ncbi:hypothetical protein Droror1_Dr00024680 [Drosera rotundifolia]
MHYRNAQIFGFSVPPVVKSCSGLTVVELGKQVHSEAVQSRLDCNVFSQTMFLDFYAKTGDIGCARLIFDRIKEKDVVSCNCLILGMGDLDMGRRVKKFIDESNMFRDMIVAVALLEMFIKCEDADKAREVFDRMEKKDIVAWGAMMAGYAQNGRLSEALELFECMKQQKIKSSDVIISSVLTACAQLGSIEIGERIGSYLQSEGYDSNVYVASSLISMYSRLAFNGHAMDALNTFQEMKKTNVEPNDITFVALLTPCTHVDHVDSGLEYYNSMLSIHDIAPNMEHCSCIVDLFCRCAKLREAYQFICQMVGCVEGPDESDIYNSEFSL